MTPLQVGWSGVPHIEGQMGQTKDYSQLIQKAQVGWAETQVPVQPAHGCQRPVRLHVATRAVALMG